MKIGASFCKKINLGNYESAEISLWTEDDLEEAEHTEDKRFELFRTLKREVETWEKIVRGVQTEIREEIITLTQVFLDEISPGREILFPREGLIIRVRKQA